MSTKDWRFALARWGDPTWTLAVLLTGRDDAAQAAVEDAFATAYRAGPPADPEQALYAALARQRVRVDRVRRRPLLNPALRRVAPADRLLLGLWLLREQHGEQLAAITGLTPSVLQARLAAAIAAWAGRDGVRRLPSPDDLAALVAQRLLPTPPTALAARSLHQTAHTTIVDQLQHELLALTHRMHFPAEMPARIEQGIVAQQNTPATAWWQRTAVWQAGLVAAIIAVLAFLLVPRSANREAASTGAPPDAQELVQTTLERWAATTNTMTHRRVWALDALRSGGGVVTDVWLAAGTSAQHRVEVRRDDQLLEWQVADGDRRLNYGTIVQESACPWGLTRSGDERSAVSFRIAPEDQRRARDARLQHGAYGTGYMALLRALAAPDLRSFGTRVVGGRSFATLIYSDTYWGAGQQVVLRIDPATSELYGVQTVSLEGVQSSARDVWRMDVREDAAFIPTPLPDWSEAERADRLLDPACLMLRADDIHDLRTTLDDAGPQWFLPAALPKGVERAAIIAPIPREIGLEEPAPATAQWSGHGRFLSITHVAWRPSVLRSFAGTPDAERGMWYVARTSLDSDDPARLTLHLRHDRDAGMFPELPPNASGWASEQILDTYAASIEVTARGWTEDELNAVVDSLVPASPSLWARLHTRFVSPTPLDATTLDVLTKAIAALEPPASGTILTRADSTMRPRASARTERDPYHIADDLWMSGTTKLWQTMVYSASQVVRFDDRSATAGSTPQHTRWSNGSDFIFSNYAQGWTIQGDGTQLGATAYPTQPGVAMLATFLASNAPITITSDANTWKLERSVARTLEELNEETGDRWNVAPWTAGLPTGEMTYRLWLDRATAQPQRIEIAHVADGARTVVMDTTITERRISDDLASIITFMADTGQPDTLLFRWEPGVGSVLDQRMVEQTDSGLPLIWNEGNGAPMQWQLDPVGAMQPLGMSAFDAPRWFNMSRLSAVHRALYRVGDAEYMGVLVSQGPKNLMRHVIRYSETTRGADAMPWTTSRPLTVTILGVEREAWLLAHNEVAALVVELDDRLIHIMGMRSYLESEEMRDLLTWLKPPPSGEQSGGTHDDGVTWSQNLFSSPGVYRPSPYFGN